mgnify:CR=1 FL=1
MPITATHQVFHGLDCLVIHESNATPDLLVVLCHGFGAPGDDLADLGPWLMQNSPALAERCRFVFPAAPLDLAQYNMPGARAWWPINMAMLARINETQDFSQLTAMTPPGMHDAAQQLHTAINQMQQQQQQQAQFGGAGQLGSAREALADRQLAGATQAAQMQTAAGVQQQIAAQRAAAAGQLAQLGQGGIGQALGAAGQQVTASLTPQQLYNQYASVIFGTPAATYSPDFRGTQGSTTTTDRNAYTANLGWLGSNK